MAEGGEAPRRARASVTKAENLNWFFCFGSSSAGREAQRPVTGCRAGRLSSVGTPDPSVLPTSAHNTLIARQEGILNHTEAQRDGIRTI